MTQQEYEQKKAECWHEYFSTDKRLTTTHEHEISKDAFYSAFDRAYALGKETITNEEVEKAAEEFADKIRIPASIPGVMVPFINGLAHDSYLQGAQDIIGKQEKSVDGQETLTCEKTKALYHFRMAEACKTGNNPESDYWIGYSKAIQELFGFKGEPYVEPNGADTVISGWVCRDNNSLNAQVLIGDKPKRTGFNYWENQSADCERRMNINGIVYRGKFYRALPMHIADLFEEMVNGYLRYTKVTYRMEDGKLVEDIKRYRFRYSPELTNKINKE